MSSVVVMMEVEVEVEVDDDDLIKFWLGFFDYYLFQDPIIQIRGSSGSVLCE